MNEYCTLITVDGKHLVAMPNGDIIPTIAQTIVKQDGDQAIDGTCEVTLVLSIVRIK